MKFSPEQQERIVNQLMNVVYPKLPGLLDKISALDKMTNAEKAEFVALQEEIISDIAAAFGLGGPMGKLALGPILLAAKAWLKLNKEQLRTRLKDTLDKQQ